MSESTGHRRLLSAGGWYAVLGDRVTLLLPGEERARVAGLWELVDDGADFDEVGAQFSPDTRWIAYQANESGRFEIFVQSFPGGDSRAQVTTEGGTHPRWSIDGRTLFYVAPGGMHMRVSEAGGARIDIAFRESSMEVDRAFPLGVRLRELADGAAAYEVIPSGFVAATAGEGADRPLTVLLNWNPRP